MIKNNEITIGLTSCGRYNLLKKTISSLGNNIDLGKYKKIIVEDSKNINHINKIKKANKEGFLIGWNIIYTNGIKQHGALEELYKNISTKYTFHCEDDWFFEKVNYDFFEISKNILEKYNDIGLIQLRNFKKDGGLKSIEKTEIERFNELFSDKILIESKIEFIYFRNDEKGDLCKGFSYNPGLRRTDEMKKIMFGYENYVDEYAIGKRFSELGLKGINIRNPITYHIGNSYLSTRFKALFDDGLYIGFKKVLVGFIKARLKLLIKYIKGF